VVDHDNQVVGEQMDVLVSVLRPIEIRMDYPSHNAAVCPRTKASIVFRDLLLAF
jgi:hypothetical protein